MQQESPKEFPRLECERLHATAVPVVLPPKGHGVVGHVDESVVLDRHAVGVPREIVEHVGRAPEQRQSILPIVTEKRLSSITRIIL